LTNLSIAQEAPQLLGYFTQQLFECAVFSLIQDKEGRIFDDACNRKGNHGSIPLAQSLHFNQCLAPQPSTQHRMVNHSEKASFDCLPSHLFHGESRPYHQYDVFSYTHQMKPKLMLLHEDVWLTHH
jgi:hypothetical protein